MTVREVARALTEDEVPPVSVPAARAARELGLKRGEFDLAVHLGLIATEPAAGAALPRVQLREIERLRARPDFPDSLRDRVRTAGTAEGAALLGISPVRFAGLARVGCVSPVAFCLNRCRVVVWVYLVEELTGFAAREPGLLSGRSPAGMRTTLAGGTDRRARNWRSGRIDRMLQTTEDPWARAALEASALDPVQLAQVVDDPYERAYLTRMQQVSAFGRPGSVSGREAMARLMVADDPDEILWRRVNLAAEIDRARDIRPAPGPGGRPSPVPEPSRGPTRQLEPGSRPHLVAQGAGHVRVLSQVAGDIAFRGRREATGAGRIAPRGEPKQGPSAGRHIRRPGAGSGGGRCLLARMGLARPDGEDPTAPARCSVRPQ